MLQRLKLRDFPENLVSACFTLVTALFHYPLKQLNYCSNICYGHDFTVFHDFLKKQETAQLKFKLTDVYSYGHSQSFFFFIDDNLAEAADLICANFPDNQVIGENHYKKRS